MRFDSLLALIATCSWFHQQYNNTSCYKRPCQNQRVHQREQQQGVQHHNTIPIQHTHTLHISIHTTQHNSTRRNSTQLNTTRYNTTHNTTHHHSPQVNKRDKRDSRYDEAKPSPVQPNSLSSFSSVSSFYIYQWLCFSTSHSHSHSLPIPPALSWLWRASRSLAKAGFSAL